MNNNVLAAHLQHYIFALLEKETTQQTFLKVVKWNGSPPNAKMLKLPGGAFLLLQQDSPDTVYSTMNCLLQRNPRVWYCIGHLPNNRTESEPNPNPYWNLPKYTQYTCNNLGMIVGATHRYRGEQPSPKYVGVDVTNIFDTFGDMNNLFNWLHSIANGDVVQQPIPEPALTLADYTPFLRNHYKNIVATLGTRDRRGSGRISWPELHARFVGVFEDGTGGYDVSVPYEDGDDEIPFSNRYDTIVDKFFLKS